MSELFNFQDNIAERSFLFTVEKIRHLISLLPELEENKEYFSIELTNRKDFIRVMDLHLNIQIHCAHFHIYNQMEENKIPIMFTVGVYEESIKRIELNDFVEENVFYLLAQIREAQSRVLPSLGATHNFLNN